MAAQIIDGKALANKLRQDVKQQATTLIQQGITPCLAVILVGEDPASQVYVKNKINACSEVGFKSILEQYSAELTEAELVQRIQALNNDPLVDGILVQLPLPKHINSHKVIECIAAHKDVDGFHVSSAGALMTGTKGFWPCTPFGCMKILENINYDLAGKHAVVVGRSNIVGKPVALMLLQKNATVTICHSATKNLTQILLQADVIIAAVGKANFIRQEMVKPGAVVIDVGINRDAKGKLCGDVDFAKVKNRASYITPVPGGVGPMTITMLLTNTLLSAQQRYK